MEKIKREQLVETDIFTLWDFISTPKNLNTITPPEMDFVILSTLPDKMYSGMIIEYLVKIPVFGKRNWVTEIKNIREGISFVDEQRIGPYKFWYHYHELEKVETNKTIMRDTVYYEAPYGLIGKAAGPLYLRGVLKNIFDFRSEKISGMFQPPEGSS